MKDYIDNYKQIINCIVKYQQLVDCHLVDFFTKNLWNQCLPEALRIQLEKASNNYIDGNKVENIKCLELKSFIDYTKSLNLENCPNVLCKETLLQELLIPVGRGYKENDVLQCHTKMGFMNNKKVHEVMALGEFVGKITESISGLVIDAGAGKAYLSTYLSKKYELPVLAVDSSTICHQGAIQRQEKMNKKKQQSTQSIKYVVEKIDANTDYKKMVNTYFPSWNIQENLILTGLHTCGDLVHSLIKTFMHVDDMRAMCIVPCCYHLTTTSFALKLSKNARMLAQQSLERNVAKNKGVSASLFYRAVLQVLLHSLGSESARIGRGAPLDDFPTYAKWALSKIGFNENHIPTDTALQQLYNSYVESKWKLEVFQTLRIYLAPVLEAAIILDSVIHLRQNCKDLRKSVVLRVFDPILSPRHYAIVAIK